MQKITAHLWSEKEASYQHLALPRGINVSGNNIMRITDLIARFEQTGFADVMTYIQSDNILFRKVEQNMARLTDKIERVLSDPFDYISRVVVVITHNQLKSVVECTTRQLGKDAAQCWYGVILLNEPQMAGLIARVFL